MYVPTREMHVAEALNKCFYIRKKTRNDEYRSD